MTFEKSRSTWNSGFRGYKDNSPEAKHRRLQATSDRLYEFKMRLFLDGMLVKGTDIFVKR